jgi:hypothetical protein
VVWYEAENPQRYNLPTRANPLLASDYHDSGYSWGVPRFRWIVNNTIRLTKESGLETLIITVSGNFYDIMLAAFPNSFQSRW